MINPALATNPLRSRSDLQQAVRDLFNPLLPFFSEGSAAIHLAGAGTRHGSLDEDFESFARPLWGLIPLAAGGGEFPHWDLYRQGLVNGSDPSHPEYWQKQSRADQQHVEMAVIGLGLAMAPERFWTPLTIEERE